MTAIERLDAAAAEAGIAALGAILRDCVEDGASVNFVLPFSQTEAESFWRRQLPAIASGEAILFAARHEGLLAGTVILALDTPPNQRHRADIRKLLVHRRARRHGLARALMRAAENEAQRLGRSLLTLDTVQGSTAEGLYLALGYTVLGVMPRYALAANGTTFDSCTFFYKDFASGRSAG